jgi:hypothetical protein
MRYKLFIARVIVIMFMMSAAAVSAGDIIRLAERFGVPAPVSYTVPLFIDGLAYLGLVGRAKVFARGTRRYGMALIVTGATLSLAANVMAGTTLGLRVYGALVVMMFVAAEIMNAKLEAAPAAPEREHVKVVRKLTDREKAARKRAGYSEMSKAEKMAWSKSYRARTASTNPVSPPAGPGSVSVEALEAIAR